MTPARWTLLTLVLLSLGTAPGARAGVLTSASLTLAMGSFAPATFAASGLAAGQASGTGATATWTVATGAVPTGFASFTRSIDLWPPVSQFQVYLDGNPDAGAFAASTSGALPLDLGLRLRGIFIISIYPVPLPIPVGTPGTLTDYRVGLGVTATGNAWTTKTTTLALTTPTSGGADAATAMGANTLAGGAGSVVLVTAVNLLTSRPEQLPTFATLTLNYVPEPGGLALVAAGIAGLALADWRRRRRRR